MSDEITLTAAQEDAVEAAWKALAEKRKNTPRKPKKPAAPTTYRRVPEGTPGAVEKKDSLGRKYFDVPAANDPERDVPTNPDPGRKPGKAPAVAPDASNADSQQDDLDFLPKTHKTPEKPLAVPDSELPATFKPGMGNAAGRSPAEQKAAMQRTPQAGKIYLGNGVNETYLMELADGTRGVWKPAKGETPMLRESVKGGTYWRREIAAYEMADAIGFGDLIPVTTARDGKEDGSIQTYIDGARDADKVPITERYDGHEDAARAAALDYLMGHIDRHDGNWMIKDDKLSLIDNGLSFPNHYDAHDWFNMKFLKHACDYKLAPPDLTHLKDKWPAVQDALESAGLGPEAIALTMARFDTLTRRVYKRWGEVPALFGKYGSMEALTRAQQRVPRKGGKDE